MHLELRSQTSERPTDAIEVLRIPARRIHRPALVNRTEPDVPAARVFTPLEWRILDRLVPKPACPPGIEPLSVSIPRLAEPGGFLARKGDGSPAGTVLRRGIARRTDIEPGAPLAGGDVGDDEKP